MTPCNRLWRDHTRPAGVPATPADINRNGRPTSIGTSGRHQSECPADIIGMRKARDPEMHQTKKGNQWYFGREGNNSLFLVGCTYTQPPCRRHGSIGYAATYTQILRAIEPSITENHTLGYPASRATFGPKAVARCSPCRGPQVTHCRASPNRNILSWSESTRRWPVRNDRLPPTTSFPSLAVRGYDV